MKTSQYALMLVLVLVCLNGCASTQYIYNRTDLDTMLQERLTSEQREEVILPFQANAEMHAFAYRVTRNARSTKKICKDLVEAILSKSSLNVTYNRTLTKTAQDLFYTGEGNCLAYTNLFIGLARSVGVRAFFVDASLLVNDVEERGGMVVNNGHICAAVYSEPELLFVDFSNRIYKQIVGYKFIDDLEAIAHFYNNLGYEKRQEMLKSNQKVETMSGIEEFEMAIRVSPDFYRAYNNVAVAYQQLGKYDKAMEYYKKAIEIKPDFDSAFSNLGMLAYKNNDLDKAKKYFNKAIKLNSNNHFSYYYLGLIEIRKENYKEALKLLEQSIKMKSDFNLAYLTMSSVYRTLGEPKKAEKMMQKSREINSERAESEKQ